MSYIEWAVLGDLTDRASVLPPELTLGKLAGKPTGEIARALRTYGPRASDDAVRDWLAKGADALGAVAPIRNHALHARPATVVGRQRLHRWREGEDAFTVTEEWLDESLRQIEGLASEFFDSRRLSRASHERPTEIVGSGRLSRAMDARAHGGPTRIHRPRPGLQRGLEYIPRVPRRSRATALLTSAKGTPSSLATVLALGPEAEHRDFKERGGLSPGPLLLRVRARRGALRAKAAGSPIRLALGHDSPAEG